MTSTPRANGPSVPSPPPRSTPPESAPRGRWAGWSLVVLLAGGIAWETVRLQEVQRRLDELAVRSRAEARADDAMPGPEGWRGRVRCRTMGV